MACFIVPTAEAIVTTCIEKAIKSKEKEQALQLDTMTNKIPASKKISWLNKMLWGGSALLALEHIWHGEISPVFPFLTALGNEGDTAAMLYEMSTVGVSMAVLVTVFWGVLVLITNTLGHTSKDIVPENHKEV